MREIEMKKGGRRKKVGDVGEARAEEEEDDKIDEKERHGLTKTEYITQQNTTISTSSQIHVKSSHT